MCRFKLGLLYIILMACSSAYRIALTESGHLLEICPFTRTFSFTQSALSRALLIEDLLVMESSDEHVEFLILTKPTADGERFIKFIEYPCKF